MPGRGHWARLPLLGGHGHEEVHRPTGTERGKLRGHSSLWKPAAARTSPALFPVGIHAKRHLFPKTSVTA